MRVTISMAILFFTTSIGLNYLVTYAVKKPRVMELQAPKLPQKQTSTSIEELEKKVEHMPVLPAGIPERKASSGN
jgi:preprotein translocase subunit SecG